MAHHEDKSVINLLIQLQNGDESVFEALRELYAPLMLSTVSKILAGDPGAGELEDLMQEAALALYNAAMNYDCNQTQVTFGLYAKICIRNRMISLLRRQSSQKRRQRRETPGSSVADRKSRRLAPLGELSQVVEGLLSPLEQKVYQLYIAGYSTAEIAKRLSKDEKSVENAIYRLRSKIKSYCAKP